MTAAAEADLFLQLLFPPFLLVVAGHGDTATLGRTASPPSGEDNYESSGGLRVVPLGRVGGMNDDGRLANQVFGRLSAAYYR